MYVQVEVSNNAGGYTCTLFILSPSSSFFSTLLSAVLSQHLAWVDTVSRDRDSSRQSKNGSKSVSWVCVCESVCVRERQRESACFVRESVCVCMRECVCERERESVCVREKERVCV